MPQHQSPRQAGLHARGGIQRQWRLTTTNSASASCAFFGQARCDHAFDRDACLARIAGRYKDCVNVLGGSIASRRQDCEEKSRDSDRLCLDELRDCRASCQ